MQTSDEPIISEPTPAPPAPRGGGRRLVWVIVAVLVVSVLVVIGLAGISALGVRRHLLAGRDALTRGKDELVDGDAATARDEFEDARTRSSSPRPTARVRSGSRSPMRSRSSGTRPTRSARWRTPGCRRPRPPGGLAAAVADLPGGLGALAPTADGIPIDRLAALTDATARADELTGHRADDARVGAHRVRPRTGLVGPVGLPRPSSRSLHRQLHAGSLILGGLPAFLGADGPRHYVFGASNPAELRGTGGLIGAYAILTVDQGRLSFSDFRPIQSLPRPDVSDVPSPSQEYSDNYDFYRSGLGSMGQHEHDAGLPARGRRVLAHVRGHHGRGRGRRHAGRPVRAEGVDARDGSRSRSARRGSS